MQALPIVPGFDVLEDGITSSSAGLPDRIAELGFHRAKETLDDGIVPALTFSAHALLDAVCGKHSAKFFACILATAVRVKEHPRRRRAIFDRSHEGVDHEASIHRHLHRPTDNASRKKIEDDGKIQPPFARRQVGDIARPDAVWAADDLDIEVPPKHVLGDR